MAYVPVKTEELKKLVMMGKKRPMNLAYNPGPKNSDLLIIDRIKAPEVIARVAKKEGEGTRVAFGTFEIDARKFNLTLSQELPGLAKKLRKYLKTLDFSFGVEIFDIEGNSLEADDEDEDDVAPIRRQRAPATPDKARKRQALTDRLRAIQGPIAAFGTAGAPLRKAVNKVVNSIKVGDLAGADKMLGRVETAIAKAQSTHNQPEGKDAPAPADAKALMARAGSLKNVVADLPPEAAGKIKAVLVQAISLLQARDFAAADKRITAAENAVNALSQRQMAQQDAETPETVVSSQEEPVAGTAPIELPPSADEKAWNSTLKDLENEVEEAEKAGKGDPNAINRAFDYAKALAAAGKFTAALRAAESTSALITAADEAAIDLKQEGATEAPEMSADNVIDFDASRIEWVKTRNGMKAELAKLKMAIDTQTRNVNGYETLASQTSVLLDYIEELDTSLEDAMVALLATGDGAQRQKLIERVKKIVADYRNTLDTDFFKSVDQNGFVDTAIRDTALTALQEVEKALAA